MSKLAEVKTSEQTWNRGLERLQLPLPPSAGEMQFGHCRVSHCGGCILQGGYTKCTPDLWSFSSFCCFFFFKTYNSRSEAEAGLLMEARLGNGPFFPHCMFQCRFSSRSRAPRPCSPPAAAETAGSPAPAPRSTAGSLPAFYVCLAPSAVLLWPPDVTVKQIIMNSRANNNELFNTPTHTPGAKNEFSISSRCFCQGLHAGATALSARRRLFCKALLVLVSFLPSCF